MITLKDIATLKEIDKRHYDIKRIGLYNLHKIIGVAKQVARLRAHKLVDEHLIELSKGKDNKIIFNPTEKGKIALKNAVYLEDKANEIIKTIQKDTRIRPSEEQKKMIILELKKALMKILTFGSSS